MALGFGGARRRRGRLAGLGLPALRPGRYPKGKALAAACRSMLTSYQRARGDAPSHAWLIHDRALAMGCSWVWRERTKRSG